MRGDARKRVHPEPLAHPDPAVCELIERAFDEGRQQGHREGWQAATDWIKTCEVKA